MTMLETMRKEVERVCKKINPGWDGESFDYDCSCYKSALKAYESLTEDDHSGFSWSFTARILKRMLDGLPLTPINEEDFDGTECIDDQLDKQTRQCPRMSSLFQHVSNDGTVSYSDIDRMYCFDTEFPDDTFSSSANRIVDELFPITLPYYPSGKKYRVGVRSFLCDPKNGDYDHRVVEYVITPDNERIEVGKYYREEGNEMVEITKEQFREDEQQRKDPVSIRTASRLQFLFVDTELIESDKWTTTMTKELGVACKVFENVDPELRTYGFLESLVSYLDGDKDVEIENVERFEPLRVFFSKYVDKASNK